MTGTGRCATIAGRAGHFINNDMFQKLKALAKPIVKPCSENVDELKADMEKHDERAQSFIDSLRSDAITIKFGDHSDYFNWMICHRNSVFVLRHQKPSLVVNEIREP